jgi:competence protein ComEA
MSAEQIEDRLRELARRAGLVGVPPAVVGAALLVFALAVGFAIWRWWPRTGEGLAAPVVASAQQSSAAQGTDPKAAGATGGSGAVAVSRGASSSVCVHVVGAVKQPGVYELSSDSRVRDAVDAAGGVTTEGAPDGLNLARTLTDGEQVVVPTQAELATGRQAGAAGGVAAGGVSGGAGAAAPGAKVNINTADATLLDTLPGVGPSTAARIVADREANGPYASAEDLGRVSGIGPKKLEQLKGSISVR